MAIIDVKSERRKDFIEKFEEKGFIIDKRFSKEEIIESVLPITLDFKTKEIGRIGNVTCAAAALSQGAIKKEDEFWKMLEEGKLCEMEDYQTRLLFL